RSSSPPLRHPCYFGIDIPQESELIAAGRTVEEIAAYIGVDSLGYLSVTGLGRAIASANGDTELDDVRANASLHSQFCYGCMVKQGWPYDPRAEQENVPFVNINQVRRKREMNVTITK
ncbi:MAG TPA: hypothetical protein VFQ36_10525, partial [Ktedonobacteraceae bacterium]|nr:hypothetical protein [Ktedonobacteraceae bacterium]